MRAVRISAPGGPEVLRLTQEPDPEPGSGELSIEIHASALNRADLLQRRGLYPPPAGSTEIPGLECAGVVTAIGSDTDPAWVGRRVMALLPGGGHAERVVIPARLALEIPASMSFVEAACIPEAFITAHEALCGRAQLQPGDTVLVHAGASGVGSATVQLALALGAARVFATAGGEHKCEFVRSLGAHCIDRHSSDFATELAKERIDVIVDLVGSRYYPAHSRLLAPGGRHVIVGLLGGNPPASVDFARLLSQQQSLLGMVLRTHSTEAKIALSRRFAREVLPWFETGRLRPLLDRVFALADIQAAHERMERGENLGKIVLEVKRSER